MEKFIDVSSYQGKIDWEKVKGAGIDFAILRATVKSGSADTRFVENVQGCREAGVGFDVYKYSYALTPETSRQEAQKVTELLRNNTCGAATTVWWDMEDNSQRKLKKSLLTAIIKAAQTEILDAGYTFGIYCNKDWYQNVLDTEAFDCPFWVARYPSTKEMPLAIDPDEKYKPDFVTQYLMGWQYTSKGRVPGISGNVDVNIYYEPEGIGTSTVVSMPTIRYGSRGDAVKVLQTRLNAAGYNCGTADGIWGGKTDAAVRAFQKARGLAVDGIVGPKTWAELMK